METASGKRDEQATRRVLEGPDTFVTILAGLVSRFRVVVLVGTILAFCAVVYLIAWAIGNR